MFRAFRLAGLAAALTLIASSPGNAGSLAQTFGRPSKFLVGLDGAETGDRFPIVCRAAASDLSPGLLPLRFGTILSIRRTRAAVGPEHAPEPREAVPDLTEPARWLVRRRGVGKVVSLLDD